MRFNRFGLLTGLAGLVLGFVIAHAQAPAPPTLEQAREAVANLRGDRIWRPSSYDELTAEQKAFVNGIAERHQQFYGLHLRAAVRELPRPFAIWPPSH